MKSPAVACVALVSLLLAGCTNSGDSSSTGSARVNTHKPRVSVSNNGGPTSSEPSDETSSKASTPTNTEVTFEYTDKDGWHYTGHLSAEPVTLTLSKDISQSPPGQAQMAFDVEGDDTPIEPIPDDNEGRPNGPKLSVFETAYFVAPAARRVMADPSSVYVEHDTGTDETWSLDQAWNINSDNGSPCIWDFVYDFTDDRHDHPKDWMCNLGSSGAVTSKPEVPESLIDQLVSDSPMRGRIMVNIGSNAATCWFWVDPRTRSASLPTAADVKKYSYLVAGSYEAWKSGCQISNIQIGAG